MSKDIEAVFRELNRFLEQNSFESEEEAIQAFMEHMNAQAQGSPKRQEPDAYDYLEKAQNAFAASSAVKYAKKALELDPTLTEAELVIAVSQSKTKGQLQSTIEELLKKEEWKLAKQGITEAECSGDYYEIFETRPYIRILAQYVDTLIEQGKLRRAAEACRKVLTLNENDNTGTRYNLMAIYAALEESELAEALDRRYPADTCFMMLPMIALYYKLEDEEKASACLARLCGANSSVKQAIRLLKKGDEDAIGEIAMQSYYSPFTKEEVVLAYIQCSFLYEPLGKDFLLWLEKHIPAKTSSGRRGRKKN